MSAVLHVCILLALLLCQHAVAFVSQTASGRVPTNAFRPAQSGRPSWTARSSRLFAKSGRKKKKPRDNTICVNRAARRNYEILETYEAGISLKGTEVKSIRDGKITIVDGWVKANKNGRSCTLMNVHIGKHSMSGEWAQHEERRPRPLLLHRSQSRRLMQKSEATGLTIVPLKAYFNDDNRVKFEIALCRGKNVRDKRADIKERDMKRDMGRLMKSFRL